MTEFVEIRFKLHRVFDARILDRIKEQANGAGYNPSARFLMLHWFETERQVNSPQLGRAWVPQGGQDEDDLDDQITDALASISDDW